MDTSIRPPLLAQTGAAHPRGPQDLWKMSAPDRALMQKATDLEAAFLSEMLGHAGLGAAPEGFDGGIGEEQFSSFLRAEQGKAMAAKGGIGLAEQIFNALKERALDAN